MLELAIDAGYILLVALVPLFPAYLLYSKLPNETLVSGPFKGLQLHMTGAFGGYFVLVLLLVGIVGTFQLSRPRQVLPDGSIIKDVEKAREQWEGWAEEQLLWTVSGNVALLDSSVTQDRPPLTQIVYTLRPNMPQPNSDGHIDLSDVPIVPGKQTPELLLHLEGYKTEGIVLTTDSVSKWEVHYTYRLAFDSSARAIEILDTVRLRPDVN